MHHILPQYRFECIFWLVCNSSSKKIRQVLFSSSHISPFLSTKEKKYFKVLFWKCAAYKSNYALKPLLSQNSVHFYQITISWSTLWVGYFGPEKVLILKKYFLVNPMHTNPNVPPNINFAKIWCILRSQGRLFEFDTMTSISSTELTRSSPLKKYQLYRLSPDFWSELYNFTTQLQQCCIPLVVCIFQMLFVIGNYCSLWCLW